MASTAERLAGRYTLGPVLGRGGMGVVHQATDERLDRQVAVKILPPIEASLSDRLRQEARVLARLDHPALVRIFDADEDDGRPFIVMDLVEGDTLAIRLQDGALDEPTVRRLVGDIAEGLEHAHGKGVIHRDLKPANLVIGADGRTRVVDFGIARLIDATGLTEPGMAVGTAAYLAPEQLGTDTEVGPAADVYALGLVALEALTGERPFAGSGVETALARLDRPPSIPDSLAAPWPQLLRSMTALDPSDRPTAGDVLATLADPKGSDLSADDTVADTGALKLGDLGGGTRVMATQPASAPVPASPRPRPRPDRPPRRLPAVSRRTLVIAAAAVALVAFLAFGLLVAGDDDVGDVSPAAEQETDPTVEGTEALPPEVLEALDELRAAVTP